MQPVHSTATQLRTRSSAPSLRGLPIYRKALLIAGAAAVALSILWVLGASALLDFHVSREPDGMLAARAERIGKMVLWGGFWAIIAITVAGLAVVERLITRWVAVPARDLALAADAITAGDLSTQLRETGIDDVGRMSRATIAMIVELRRLAVALGSSSGDTTRLAQEISAAAEELAAGAGEMASTAGELSEQSTTMASSIQAITEASGSLAQVAAELDRGAHEAAGRNRELRELSLENRARLDESSRVLGDLSVEAAEGVVAVESLVKASEEIRTFVTLVRKLARQSKLLALNAAMEAARAGDEGEGFAVVANEVRRLAAMSSDAAERTEAVVGAVLGQVEQTRRWSRRTEETVRQVSSVTATGARSFERIEATVSELDKWASTIEHSAGSAHQLTQEITTQLGSLSLGTDTFASAMEQVAASSQQQSAATEEVAAAAAHLTVAAEKLAGVVAHLRVEGAEGAAGGGRQVGETALAVGRRPSAAETPMRNPALAV